MNSTRVSGTLAIDGLSIMVAIGRSAYAPTAQPFERILIGQFSLENASETRQSCVADCEAKEKPSMTWRQTHMRKRVAGPRLSTSTLVLVGIAIGQSKARLSALLATTVSLAHRRWLPVPAVGPVTGPDYHDQPDGPSIVAGSVGYQSGATGHPDLGRSTLALLYEGAVPGTTHHRVDASPGPRYDSDKQRGQGRTGCHPHDGSHLLDRTFELHSRCWCVPCSCISLLGLPCPRSAGPPQSPTGCGRRRFIAG